MAVRMFLDDIRNPGPDLGEGFQDWVTVRTAEDAIRLLSQGDVVECSLDHDLGRGKTGYDVVCWMEEHNVWPPDGVWCHSANPVGCMRIRDVINKHRKG